MASIFLPQHHQRDPGPLQLARQCHPILLLASPPTQGHAGPAALGAQVGNGAAAYPPTPAMKRFADSLARQKGIKPPAGYKTSTSICRAFLNQHAPKKADGETAGKLEPKPASPAQLLYAKKIAQGKGIVIPDEAKANSATMSAWIEFEPGHEAAQAQSQDGQQAGGPPQLMLRASPQTAIRRGSASFRTTLFTSPMEGSGEEVNIVGRIRWFAREM